MGPHRLRDPCHTKGGGLLVAPEWWRWMMADYIRQRRFAGLSELEIYWNTLRRGRLVPLRSELDRRGLVNLIDGAFILERVEPRVARLRVAGSLLTEIIGLEVRGMPMTTLSTSGSRELMSDAIEQVFKGPKSAFLQFSCETGIGKPPLEAQMLILPLRSDMGDVTRAIGYLAIRGKIGRAPRRFEFTNTPIMTKLTGQEPISDVTGGIEKVKTPMANMAAPAPVTPTPMPTSSSERPYLRLVHSAD